MQKVIAIVGPTAVGKTKLSVMLAKKFNGEVINGDAMQVYKGLDIGTAKVTNEEKENIPHHLFDMKNADENYSVGEYKENVKLMIDKVISEGKIPIIVGGSGMYIEAVLYDYNFSNISRDETFSVVYEDVNNEELYMKLLELDEKSAINIHPNNRKRVLRALEIALSGKNKSDLLEEQNKIPIYDMLILGLELERDVLYERINKRVDVMISNGLENEVKELIDSGLDLDAQSVQAIGYKEWFPYFAGDITKEEVFEKIKQNSRRLAKRQYTYFRNRMDISWLSADIENFSSTIEKAGELVEKFI